MPQCLNTHTHTHAHKILSCFPIDSIFCGHLFRLLLLSVVLLKRMGLKKNIIAVIKQQSVKKQRREKNRHSCDKILRKIRKNGKKYLRKSMNFFQLCNLIRMIAQANIFFMFVFSCYYYSKISGAPHLSCVCVCV